MANWKDDEDLRRTNAYQQITWEQLQQKHAELQQHQLRKPTVSTSSGPRQLHTNQHTINVYAAADEETGEIKLLPPQQYYNSHGYSDSYTDLSSHVSDADLPPSKNHGFRATFYRSTPAVNYINLNRHQLKGQDNRKYIYPQKTYSEMFNKKKQLSVGYKNCSHKNGKWLIIYFCLSCYIITHADTSCVSIAIGASVIPCVCLSVCLSAR